METGEFCANIVTAGVADLLERADSLSPSPAGGVQVARGAVDVAEVIEGDCLVEEVGKLPIQLKGAFIAADRLTVVAELVMDVAQAVPGGGLPVAFSGLLAAGQGAFAVADGLPVVPEQSVAVTDIIQARDLEAQVAGGPGQLQGRRSMAEHVGVALLLFRDPGQDPVGS